MLLVVVSHAHIKHFLAGGYIGVDVFFVISGFLITGVLAREARSTGRVSFAKFYSRRVRRILPAASVVLLVILLASVAIYTNGHLDKVTKGVGWAAFFAANLHFAEAGTDYFAVNSFETPVQHFWSLAVEEQFYLVWPAIIAVMLVYPRPRRSPGGRHVRDRGRGCADGRAALRRSQALRRAAVLIGLLSMLSLAWSIYDTQHSPHSAYYSTFTRAWELGLGSLLALGAHRIARVPAWVRALMSWVGLAAVLLAAVTFTGSTAFPGSAALLPVVGAALIIGGGIDGPRHSAGLVLGVRPMRFIGDISYSLYLLHWPLLVMPPAYLGHSLRIPEKLLVIGVAIVLSWASYRWIETPFRTARTLRHRHLRALAMWPAALAVVLVPTVVVYESTVARAAGVSDAEQKKIMGDTPSALHQQVVKAAAKAHHGAPVPRRLSPKLVDLTSDSTEPPSGCWSSDAETIAHKLCPMGDTKSSKTIVVWGDSHSAQWLVPLGRMARKNHLKLIPLDKAACMPVDLLVQWQGRPYTQCPTYRHWAIKQIKRIQPEAVIMSGLVSMQVLDPKTKQPVDSDRRSTAMFADGARRTLGRLHRAVPHADLDIISDQAMLPKDAETCLGSRASTLATCAQPLNNWAKERDAAWERAARADGATYVDMLPWICADDICPIVVNGSIVYRDRHHLTTTYASLLQPVLEQKLDLAALSS